MRIKKKEEIVTDLVQACCDLIESHVANIFYYENTSLRGVVEREIYVAGVSDKHSLLPLLHAVLSVSKSKELPDSIKLQVSELGLNAIFKSPFLNVRQSLSGLKSSLRLLVSGLAGRDGKTHSDPVPYIFFAFDGRFADFFSDIIRKLGWKNCGFYPRKKDNLEQVASQMHVAVLQTYNQAFNPLKIRMPVTYPLYGHYMRAVECYLTAKGVFSQYKPQAVVFAEGTSNIDEALAIAARDMQIETIRVQSGRAGMLHTGYRNMSFSRMLVWGEGFIRRMKQVSPGPEYIATGNPQLDELKHPNYCEEIELFKSAYPLVSIYTQQISLNISQQAYQDLVDITGKVLAQTDDVRILVRKHPCDDSEAFEKLSTEYTDRLLITKAVDYPLADILKASTVAAGFYSTTLSEAVACGVVPVMYDRDNNGEVFPYPGQEGAAICVDSIDQAVGSILRLLNDDEYRASFPTAMSQFSEKYFGPGDGKALERIVDIIRNQAA